MRRLIVLLLLALGTGGWLLGWSPYLRVEQISVDGLATDSPLTVERVLEQAQVREGMPMARLSEAAVRRALLRIPRVGKVELTRHWPDRVTIQIRERRPWAVAKVATAKYLVDREGNFFADVGAVSDSLPVVTLSSRNGELVRDLVDVSEALPPSLRRSVMGLSALSFDQLVLSVMYDSRDVEVIWGSAEENSLKADVLQRLLDRSESSEWTRIDLSAPRAPTTRTD